jgi:hypothetical protein
MSTADAGGATHPQHGWSAAVSLDDVRTCTASIAAFLTDAESIDVSRFSQALTLFILFGGDHAALLECVGVATRRVCGEATAASDQIHGIRRIRNWQDRLMVVDRGLSQLPDSYRTPVDDLSQAVGRGITECRMAQLHIQRPRRRQLRRRN